MIRGKRRIVAVVAGSAAILLASATAANAASGTWSSSGITGVHAQGSWKTEYSKLYFSGYVKDTSCDGNPVKLEIRFNERLPGGLYYWYRGETVTNYGGCGTSKSFSFNTYQPGKTIQVTVKECLIGGGVGSIDSCSPRYPVVNTSV